jgi:hypothetical protein
MQSPKCEQIIFNETKTSYEISSGDTFTFVVLKNLQTNNIYVFYNHQIYFQNFENVDFEIQQLSSTKIFVKFTKTTITTTEKYSVTFYFTQLPTYKFLLENNFEISLSLVDCIKSEMILGLLEMQDFSDMSEKMKFEKLDFHIFKTLMLSIDLSLESNFKYMSIKRIFQFISMANFLNISAHLKYLSHLVYERIQEELTREKPVEATRKLLNINSDFLAEELIQLHQETTWLCSSITPGPPPGK